MDFNPILRIIIGLCIFIFIAGFSTRKSSLLTKLICRGLGGGVLIWTVNIVLGIFSFACPVGLNGWTIGASTVLGFPGIVMLYVMGIYAMI